MLETVMTGRAVRGGEKKAVGGAAAATVCGGRVWAHHRRWRTAAVVAALGVLAVCAPPASASVPDNYVYEQSYLSSGDGPQLHADIWRPKDRTRAPVLLRMTPYGSHGVQPPFGSRTGGGRDDVDPGGLAHFVEAYKHGWAIVTVDVRGTGGSEGCYDYGGPGEQADVETAVEWAARQDWSTGRVAMAGSSYEGWMGIIALATQPKGLVAVLARAPVVTGYDTIYDGGVMTYAAPTFPPIYTAVNYLPPSPHDDADYVANQVATDGRPCTDTIAPALDPDRQADFWRLRDMRARAATSDVPIMADQGTLDFQVTPEEILGLWPRLNGTHLQIDQRAHEPPLEAARLSARAQRFLAKHLDGTASTVRDPRVVVQEAPSLRWREETQWPPGDAAATPIPIKPGQYRDSRGNFSGDDTWATMNIPASAPAKALSGRGTWTFTQPLQREAHVSGFGTVDATVSGPPEARLVALLYDVSPDGSALLIARGASLVRDGDVQLPLAPQDWRVAPGHRIGLLLTDSDDLWYLPTPGTGQPVTVHSGTLTLPVLKRTRTQFVRGERGERFDDVKHPIHIDEAAILNATVEMPPLTAG